MNKEKLRIGLLLEDHVVPHWVYHMIEKIKSSHHSEIVLTVKRKNAQESNLSFFKKIWNLRKQLAYLLYIKLDNSLFKPSLNAFATKNLKPILNCREIEVVPTKEKIYDLIPANDIEEIKRHNIDVFIKLGFRILKGDILNSSKYGVWAYSQGDTQINRGGPVGVWEVLENWDVTSVTLQILGASPGGDKVLRKSHSYTDELSVARNKNGLYWKASSFIPRKLNQLHGFGEEKFFAMIDKANRDPSFYSNRLYSFPSNIETIKGVALNFWDSFKRKLNQLFYFKQWILLYELGDSESIATSFPQFKRMTPPKDRIWADPFVIRKNDKYFIFIEEMLFTENKGKISVIEMDENGNYGSPQLIIENDYHMSYPLLLEEHGELFMIPETGANRTIELYRCTEFPLKWEFAKVLIDDIRAADATIFKHGNKYWLFANVREVEGAAVHDELFLFHTDNFPEGEWKPHPQNPIVSDVRCARPAGNIFVQNGRIYRPAQNGSKEYGYGMQIREIVTLTEEIYEERQVQSIYPNWAKDLLGTHTLNSDGKMTVIDALIRRRK